VAVVWFSTRLAQNREQHNSHTEKQKKRYERKWESEREREKEKEKEKEREKEKEKERERESERERVRGDIKESEGEETNGIIIQFWVATTKNFFAPSVQIIS
jgi:hypothetical protein